MTRQARPANEGELLGLARSSSTANHTRVHEGGWRVCSDATGEQIVFFTPAGRASPAGPSPLPALDPGSASAFFARDLARGIRPDWRTNLPRYRHDHEIPWDVEAAAHKAIDRDSDDVDDAA